MHWFPKHNVNHLGSCGSRLSCKIPLGSIIAVSVRPKIPPLLEDNLASSFALLLVLFNPFILVGLIHELAHASNGFSSQRLPQVSSLKVLMATSSKSPSISLNISQYLSEYVFRVSSSLMDRDNKEAKGQGTLLHVIKRDPNA